MINQITWTPDVELPECELFGWSNPEQLTHGSFDDCVYDTLVRMGPDAVRDEINENGSIEIEGYSHLDVSRGHCLFLDDLLENMADKYGDPDNHHRSLSADDMTELRQLESAFVDELLKRYKPWACEPVFVVDVNVRDWLAANPECADCLE